MRFSCRVTDMLLGPNQHQLIANTPTDITCNVITFARALARVTALNHGKLTNLTGPENRLIYNQYRTSVVRIGIWGIRSVDLPHRTLIWVLP